jgi:hypothetical protein
MVALAGGETMHPEMIRAIAAQQVEDWQAVARAGFTARLARRARRARQHRRTADPLAGVRVPDYIDGTFHGPADGTVGGGARNAPGERAEAVK